MAWLQDNGDENEYLPDGRRRRRRKRRGPPGRDRRGSHYSRASGSSHGASALRAEAQATQTGRSQSESKGEKDAQAGAKSAAQEARRGQELEEEGVPQELNAQEEALNFARQSRRPSEGEVCLAV